MFQTTNQVYNHRHHRGVGLPPASKTSFRDLDCQGSEVYSLVKGCVLSHQRMASTCAYMRGRWQKSILLKLEVQKRIYKPTKPPKQHQPSGNLT